MKDESSVLEIDVTDLEDNKKLKPEKRQAVGQAKIKKKGVSERLSDTFLSDGAQEVKSHLIWDIFVPAMKETVFDIFKSGLEMVLFGTGDRSKNLTRQRRGSSTYVSYGSYYDDKQERSRRSGRTGKYNRNTNHDFRDAIFENKREAEEVLDALVDLTLHYDFATVSDFKQFAGLRAEYTDDSFGWQDLRDAKVIRVRGGYIVDLPKTTPID